MLYLSFQRRDSGWVGKKSDKQTSVRRENGCAGQQPWRTTAEALRSTRRHKQQLRRRRGRPNNSLQRGRRVRKNFVPTFEKTAPASMSLGTGAPASLYLPRRPQSAPKPDPLPGARSRVGKGKSPVMHVVLSSSRTWLPLSSKSWCSAAPGKDARIVGGGGKKKKKRESGIRIPEAVVVGSTWPQKTLTFETKLTGVFGRIGRWQKGGEMQKARSRSAGWILFRGLTDPRKVRVFAKPIGVFPYTPADLRQTCSRPSPPHFPGG